MFTIRERGAHERKKRFVAATKRQQQKQHVNAQPEIAAKFSSMLARSHTCVHRKRNEECVKERQRGENIAVYSHFAQCTEFIIA